MPNQDHIATLKLGVSVWNSWRSQTDETPDFHGANLRSINLERDGLANAQAIDLTHAILDGADLTGARLRGADFTLASLRGAILAQTDLRETYFHVAKLRAADLTEADIRGADFTKADLAQANLTRARIQYTGFDFANLSNVVGLDSCQHLGPSDIGFQALTQSGNLPRVFLQGCGLSDTVIEYLPSLTTDALQFYSCFISYSHQDKVFADKLYNELQLHGIRCWKDDHSIRLGDDILNKVDEGIRIWDKVVLICSTASLESLWVIDEIDKALEKERRIYTEKGKRVSVLIPLFLDKHIFEWVDGRATHLRSRLAGDFCDWQQPVKFEKGFKRLLTSLHAGELIEEKHPEPKLNKG